jgi:hypothetical protein
MLLHDYLRLKSAILTKAKAEVDNLLKDITDPKTKELVDDWEPGDHITDLYPQVDQKTDEVAEEVKVDSKPAETVKPLGEEAASVKTDSIPPVDPVVPDPVLPLAVPDPAAQVAAKPEENTNHTV